MGEKSTHWPYSRQRISSCDLFSAPHGSCLPWSYLWFMPCLKDIHVPGCHTPLRRYPKGQTEQSLCPPLPLPFGKWRPCIVQFSSYLIGLGNLHVSEKQAKVWPRHGGYQWSIWKSPILSWTVMTTNHGVASLGVPRKRLESDEDIVFLEVSQFDLQE